MKLNVTKRQIETSGLDNEQRSFGIKSSGMMFKILSNNLYSDKIAAVIREYGCNAYDAHIIAGKQDEPFEVHLPNAFEPFFYIRDFGPGLSEAEIYDIYTQYGASTKSDRNDQVGALGLGSKSAFAYVDQFSIESYHGGVLKTYQAYMDEVGEPKVVKVSEEASSEPNGVKVQVMVESTDFRSFADKASTVFYRFPVLPTVTGNRDFGLKKVKYMMEGKGFKIRKSEGYYDNQGACAVQGTVAYPIKESALSMVSLTDTHKLLIRLHIDIDFTIGDLDIAPSREELSYDRRTQQNILDALNRVLKSIPEVVADSAKSAKTEWEARLLYSKWIREQDYSFSTLMKHLKVNGIKWNGIEIEPNLTVVGFDVAAYEKAVKDWKALKDKTPADKQSTIPWLPNRDQLEEVSTSASNRDMQQAFKHYGVPVVSEVPLIRFTDNNIANIRGGHRYGRSPAMGYQIFIGSAQEHFKIVIVDDQKRAKHLAKYLADESIRSKTNDGFLVIPHGVTPQNRKIIIDQFGGIPKANILKLSEFPDLPQVVKAPNTVVAPTIRGYAVHLHVGHYSHGYDSMNMGGETQITDTPEDGGLYAVRYNSEWLHPDKQFTSKKEDSDTDYRVGRLIQWGSRLGFLEGRSVYAFNSSRVSSIKDNPDWTSVYDHIKTELDKLITEDYESILNIHKHTYLLRNTRVYPLVCRNMKLVERVIDKAVESGLVKKSTPVVKRLEAMITLANNVRNSEQFKLFNARYQKDHRQVNDTWWETLIYFRLEVPEFLALYQTVYKPSKAVAKLQTAINKWEGSVSDPLINNNNADKNYPLLTTVMGEELNNSHKASTPTEVSKLSVSLMKVFHYVGMCDALKNSKVETYIKLTNPQIK